VGWLEDHRRLIMKVVVWIVEGTWRSCVDSTRRLAPAGADITLLYVVDDEVSKVAHGAFAGLIGRGRHGPDPGELADNVSAKAAQEILAEASQRLSSQSAHEIRRGRVEREVVAAAEDADLLIVARDGDRSRLGPKSLGHAARFVVDHAPCPVLLVWPGVAPDIETIPTPPHPPHGHHPPPPHEH
jgi:nucleotide-binding universal stress UspA family protein